MKALNTLIDVAITFLAMVVWLEKHHSLFSAIAAIMAICWWSYQFVDRAINGRPGVIKRHIDPRQNPITSYLGALLMVISLGMFIVPLFYDVKNSINYTVPSGIGLIGLGLLLIPDDFKSAYRKFLNTKAGKQNYRNRLNQEDEL